MAKGKAAAKEKGQKTLASFFVGGSNNQIRTDVDDDDAPATAVDKKAAPQLSNLPPMSSIPDIFTDIVSRMPEIASVTDQISGRKLRVATMCSGTESPLLALELMQKSIQDVFGKKLDIQHVFSCEIEPFKQAYIERNFSPPILFRDICELGGDEATTAYGSLAPVPGDVDLLIAGTSCVDYSNLNNEKQDIDANGESGRTFRGMMSWVDNHRPPLVILENVCGAPWDKVARYFAKKGYTASFLRMDTKNYYVPHTRTRVYLLAVNQQRSSLPDAWKAMVGKLQRPASTTLDQWLLPTDDPRIHHARQRLVQESYGALDRRTGRTDWNRCEIRHQRARLEEDLGLKRPLTGWDEGGNCKLPENAWGDWGVAQVERVWDLMDITLLRSAKKGVDPSFKTQVWNLSQNVDREIGSKRLGICPCLTPSMIPYITNRGGPMVGLEALSMQGLPIDKLLLTRESEDQLADLAGNAMSTTVVGTCMLAALILGRKLLKHGDDPKTYEEKAGYAVVAKTTAAEAMNVDKDIMMKETVDIERNISGEPQLVKRPLDLSVAAECSLANLLIRAEQSARLCECEGRSDMAHRDLNRCQDCHSSSCDKCGGRPEHNFQTIDFTAEPRLAPSAFARELKAALPMSMSLSGVTAEVLDALKGNFEIPQARTWGTWKNAVLRAISMEQRFVELKRQEIWVACFVSPVASLELQLHPQRPEWRLFAKPEDKEPANSDVRRLLADPIARMVCKEGILNGVWEFALPSQLSVEVGVKGVGELVPAWEARLGLLGEYKDRTVYSRIQITIRDEDKASFDRDISGSYDLLEKCGTANSSLHKKIATDLESSSPPLFLFLDPSRCGEPADDCFVFSISKRRYQFNESRPVVCKLNSKWRPSSVGPTEESVSCLVSCKWVKAEAVDLQSSHIRDAEFLIPGNILEVEATNDACNSANALLVCKVPLKEQAGPEWPRGRWVEVDKVHERVTFKALAWLIERIKNINDAFDAWNDIEVPGECPICPRCAPQHPKLRWVRTEKKIIAMEDPAQAGAFERALKDRPSPFVTQLKLEEENGVGTVRIGINIPSLIHRALSRLPTRGRTERPRLSWRLNTDFTDPAKLHLPKFTLKSNRHDKEHSQPPHFICDLRKEQLRSLEWMLKQESKEAPPFVEEEIAEAILDHLGWRAQGRAQRPVHIRGGVLADEVGYGKTAITLGLIASAAEAVKKEPRPPADILKGKIKVKGTLVVVPPHLTRQWSTEVKKFTGNHFTVVTISTASSINGLTIEDIQDADIVVVASNLFHSNVYLANLEAFAAGGTLPTHDGRYFNTRLEQILLSLRSQVTRLRKEGPKAALTAIHEARKRDDDAEVYVQKKRLKGARGIAAAEAEQSSKLPKEQALGPSSTGPKGLIMEVVISPWKDRATAQSYKSISSSSDVDMSSEVDTTSEIEAASGWASEPDESDGEELHTPRLRKRSARAAIVISDDENEEDEDTEAKFRYKATAKAPKGAKSQSSGVSKKKKKNDSDYEDSTQETEEEEAEIMELSVAESESESKMSKQKTSSRPKLKKKAASSASSDVDMEVDEVQPAKKGNAKKRKSNVADESKRPVKKHKLREETDPWKLKSKGVTDDWTQMQAPPLEMFHFERLVIDEYTYLDGKILSMVTKLTATRRWVLSGTPPIHEFAALKTIAAFLDIHLGVDDDGEGQSAQVKKRRREQTDVEKFHSFREVRSLEWHAHRHELGQMFLDQFVRQNIAEIDEIPWEEKVELINLPAAERAIYLELEHHLRALDMTIKRGRKTESDREKRLAQALGDSNSAEEALLKRCSHFDLDVTDQENAMKACEVIVKERKTQLDDCKEELVINLKKGLELQKKVDKNADETFFQEYVRVIWAGEGVGDKEATETVHDLLRAAGIEGPLTSLTTKHIDGRAKINAKGKGKEVEVSSKMKDIIWDIREQTHDIRRLTKELVGRVRSLRYFTVVRDLQKQAETPPTVDCPMCGRDNVPIEEVAVLSSCGHTGCLTCVTACAEREECVYAASGACKAAARVLNVVKGDTLGVDDRARDGGGRHFGLKLEKIIELIKTRIPKKERVLVFVQFPDLMKKVAEAFGANGIKYLEIKGTASQKSKNLEKFQEDSPERVLLLNVMDESASGANLTGANHAIFLSPLLTPSQEIYNACETQAIGRLRRYGQTKLVNIWRFFSTSTIDIDIFQQRTRKQLQ